MLLSRNTSLSQVPPTMIVPPESVMWACTFGLTATMRRIRGTGIKLNAAGEVEGAAGLIRDMRRAKPWLFGGASSSSTAAAPAAQAPTAKKATEMTFEEWQIARRELLKRR